MQRTGWIGYRSGTRSLLCLLSIIAGFAVTAMAMPLAQAQGPAPSVAAPQSTVPVSGVLPAGATTWLAGNVYLVTGSVTVPANATLVVQPGAIVKFQYDTGLDVNGALQVGGAGQPVVWTSFRDDTVGGDTNADGGATTPAAGNWYAITFAAGSRGRISNATLAYGGGNYWYYGSKALIRAFSSDVTLDHVTLTRSGYAGLYAEKANVQVNACTISNNNHYGLYYAGFDATRPLAVTNNVFSQTAQYAGALVFGGLPSGPITVRGNRATGVRNGLAAWGEMRGDLTWDNGSDLLLLPSGLTVGVTGTLRLMPGTVSKLLDGALDVNGGLIAEGTVAQPIVFTSLWDDARGGDTNADGGTLAPGVGNWYAITFAAGSRGRISNATLTYGGGNYWYYGSRALIRAYSSDVTLDHVTLAQSAYAGLYAARANVQVNACTISNNNHYGLYYAGFDATRPLTVTNNVFSQTAQYAGALAFEGLPSGPITVQGNRATGGRCGFSAWGDMRGDLTWDNGSNLVLLPSGLTVGVTGTLRLMPGTVTKFLDGALDVNGAMLAEGTTAAPLAFTSLWDDARGGDTNADGGALVPGVGNWYALNFAAGSHGRISNATIAYGGGNYWYYDSKALVRSWTSDLVMDAVTLQQSNNHGLYAVGAGPRIAASNIISMGGWGIYNATPSEEIVMAVGNYWGDPSGPYNAASNPSGKGVGVSAGVLFNPWLGQPASGPVQVQQVSLQIVGADRASPGQTVQYGLIYANQMTGSVTSAVLALALPPAATYVDSSGGTYWPERHQVFWRLGTLAPGGARTLAVRLRFSWGLANGLENRSIVLFGGSNYGHSTLDVLPYLLYAPGTVSSRVVLSRAQYEAECAGNANLQTLFSQALAEGYLYGQAQRIVLSDGATFSEAMLMRLERGEVRYLRHSGTQALATTLDAGHYALRDTAGGMTRTLATGQTEYWGGWKPSTLAAAQPNATGYLDCLNNCVLESAAGMIAGKVPGLAEMQTIGDCRTCADPRTPAADRADACAKCASAFQDKIPLVGEAADVVKCASQCAGDPESHPCAGDIFVPNDGWLNSATSLFGLTYCMKLRCTNNRYAGLPEYFPCVSGTCVPGLAKAGSEGKVGCVDCSATTLSLQAAQPAVCNASGESQACGRTTIRVARDPNALYGPEGDLLPGQWVTYTITCENEGEGQAYGVYILDDLDAAFDDRTLRIQGSGAYYGGTRTLSWAMGDLTGKGQVGSTGIVTFTVRLRGDLPSGTVVINRATVYFPSVPEQTPTNPIVSVVRPLAALPQQVQTTYITAKAITLRGTGAGPLTYVISQQPLGGTLSGSAPNITYTPLPGFTGLDRFTFIVRNAITESRAADVLVLVQPSSADTVRPQVLWTDPANGATVAAGATVSDTGGLAYRPFPVVAFSKALDGATVGASSVSLSGGGAISATVLYDALLHQVIIVPRQPWRSATNYTVTLKGGTGGVRDVSGNLLEADYVFTFRVGGGGTVPVLNLPLVLRGAR